MRCQWSFTAVNYEKKKHGASTHILNFVFAEQLSYYHYTPHTFMTSFFKRNIKFSMNA